MEQILRDEEPIAALASGRGPSPIAIIRVSGQGSHGLLSRFFRHDLDPAQNVSDKQKERKLVKLRFVDPETEEVVDDILTVFFFAPRSYTGQDAAELFCHGSPYIIQRILSALYRNGFREADPGEYTRRAFLNGKLDLTEAEGINALIQAESHQQWLTASKLIEGRLSQRIQDLKARLIDAMSFLEARIDFPEEDDLDDVSLDLVKKKVTEVFDATNRLAESYVDGRIASEGLAVILFGPPNVGKSTIMNTLLGKERSIVTPIAGTTRDYIEERCLLKGRYFRLFDTAGFREHPDEVEKIGIEYAQKLARDADLVLVILSQEVHLSSVQRLLEAISALNPRMVRVLINKSDLGKPDWIKAFSSEPLFEKLIEISCTTGNGFDELKESLVSIIDSSLARLGDDFFITSARHLDALEKAKASFDAFFSALQEGRFEECLAFELQQAAKALGTIIGEVGAEDILDSIFNRFCIGK